MTESLSSETADSPAGGKGAVKASIWRIRYVVYGLVIGVGASSLLGGLASLLSEPGSPLVNIGAFAGLYLGFVGVPVWASYRRGSRSLRLDYWLQFRWTRDLALGVSLAIALLAGQFALREIAIRVGVSREELSNSDMYLGQGWITVIVLLVFGVLLSPLAEELFFRGLTLQVFTHRFGAVIGVLVSSVLFGLVHVQSPTAASVVIVVITGLTGLGFAVLTLSTKRLGGAIIGHVTYNSLVATYVLVIVS